MSGTPGGPTEGVQGLLAGRTFLSTSVHGHDLVAGSTIRLTFQEKQITASAGCNTLFGDYRLADGTLVVQNMGGTEMGCSKPLMGQDDWLSGMLHAGLRVELDGDELALTGRGVTLHLTDRRVVNPDRPLEGTRWILDGMIAGTGPSATVSSVPQGLTPTLRIVDRTIHFFDGLNDYEGPVGPGGTITIGTDSVQITGDIGGSAVGCASGHTCSVDMSVLTQDFHYQITADRLTVTGTGRYADKGLMFVADDDAASNSGEAPGTIGAAPETTSPPVPASPAPVVTPGTVTIPTEGITERSLPGRHDSIPPQPTPESLGDPDQ